MLKKSPGAPSQVMRKIFPYLIKFQEKYKGIMGNLLQTVNQYIVKGRGEGDMFD